MATPWGHVRGAGAEAEDVVRDYFFGSRFGQFNMDEPAIYSHTRQFCLLELDTFRSKTLHRILKADSIPPEHPIIAQSFMIRANVFKMRLLIDYQDTEELLLRVQFLQVLHKHSSTKRGANNYNLLAHA